MKTFWFTLFSVLLWSTTLLASTGILSSKHNMSSWGPGEVKALTEDQVCIFCHTPHNATPLTPLWNRNILEGTNYELYESSTLKVTLSQPSGPSRLCLSCHDGTVGIGAVMSVTGGIAMTKELTARSTMLGTDLRDDHPFSFSYNEALPNNPELHLTAPADLTIYAGGGIHCSTCHDPHDNSNGQFLAVSNKNSGLCIRCHNISSWAASTHATSTATWNGSIPAQNPWPWNAKVEAGNQRHTVAENGCENCHVSHNAGGKQRLMKFQAEEDNCITKCHNGQVGSTNIAAEFQKNSRHHLELASIGDNSGHAHDPTEDVSSLSGHVECQDCHDPHGVSKAPPLMPTMVNGRLQGVSGIDKAGSVVTVAQFEYEICFKCHANSDAAQPVVTRVLRTIDKRKVFDPSNQTLTPSFHPIIGPGRNSNVPSLPSQDEPSLNVNSTIYCSSCHDSDRSTKVGGTGPNGPHGSSYSPILRQRYDMNVGATESFATYALCYRCHNRDNILSDASFRRNAVGNGGHSRHFLSGSGTPCSVCHDPHGVYDDTKLTGDHSNLINFDTTVVQPVSGQTYPLFIDTGAFSGTCTLVCHGKIHDGSATYSYH
jgi:predicted CXXCH cytochrome family protein